MHCSDARIVGVENGTTIYLEGFGLPPDYAFKARLKNHQPNYDGRSKDDGTFSFRFHNVKDKHQIEGSVHAPGFIIPFGSSSIEAYSDLDWAKKYGGAGHFQGVTEFSHCKNHETNPTEVYAVVSGEDMPVGTSVYDMTLNFPDIWGVQVMGEKVCHVAGSTDYTVWWKFSWMAQSHVEGERHVATVFFTDGTWHESEVKLWPIASSIDVCAQLPPC